MPIYVRAGAILPLDPVRQYTGEVASEPTTVRVYPGADAAFTLYEDDGNTQGYLDGSDAKTQWVRISWDDAQKKLALERDPRMRAWPAGMSRMFKVEVVPGAAAGKAVEFKGQRVEAAL